MIIEKELKSSAIREIRYDEDLRNLTITFRSGGKYDYPEVPKYEVEGLIKAESAGKYFNQNIKKYSIKRR